MSIWRGPRYVCMAGMFCVQIDVCVLVFIKMYGIGLFIIFSKTLSLHAVNVIKHIHNKNNIISEAFSRYLAHLKQI